MLDKIRQFPRIEWKSIFDAPYDKIVYVLVDDGCCHFYTQLAWKNEFGEWVDIPHGHSVRQWAEAPAGAITCKDHHAIISAEKFIVNYRFNNTGHSIEDPSPTICTVGQIGIASCNFIDVQYGNGTERSCEHPAPTLTTKDKCSLVTVKRFLMNPQYSSAGGSVDKPCFTLIARMDKMPPYLVATESGEAAIEVYPTDSPMTVKIKEFMALYGIVDIKMRMLKIPELKKIMGFPEDYVLVGTQAEQKKYIGNAVEVTIARRWCEALCAKLKEHFKNAA